MKYFLYLFQLITCTFIIFMFSGCAFQQPYTESHPEESYRPQIQQGMTYDIAVETLSHILSGKMGEFGIKYFGVPGINDYNRLDDLSKLFAGGNQTHRFYSINENHRNELEYVLFSSVSILDGGIAVSPQLNIPLSDLNGPIKAGKVTREYCNFVNAGLISFYFKTQAPAHELADILYTIQQLNEKTIPGDEKRLANFESVAATYRELAIKPTMPEEQRKLVVQANTLNQRKDYSGAIILYLKAIDLDQVSYPGAYFNLALLYGQLERYHKAISCMKQYLMLVPDAGDSRSAQDKIYEWEILMK